MWIRNCKIAMVTLAGAYAALVALNNITDYGSNFRFVSHVLNMDTTFPDNAAMWRALTSPLVHHAAYWTIIATEAAVALLAFAGAAAMWRARCDARQFNVSKRLAAYAMVLGIALWFGGFVVVGGEWFLMWQSAAWNGVQAAFRVSTFLALCLLVLIIEDR